MAYLHLKWMLGALFITPQILHMAHFVPLQRRLRSFYLLGRAYAFFVCRRQRSGLDGSGWTWYAFGHREEENESRYAEIEYKSLFEHYVRGSVVGSPCHEL